MKELTKSLTLCTVIAEARQKKSGNGRKAIAGLHSAMHGQAGRSGCTPAEPYPPSCNSPYGKKTKLSSMSRFDKTHTRRLAFPNFRALSSWADVPQKCQQK